MKAARETVNNILNELKSCTVIESEGRRLRPDDRGTLCSWDNFIATALIKAYSRSGCMLSARKVFESMANPSLESLNTLILGYAANGEERVALDLFSSMKGHTPDRFTYVAVLKACASLAAKGETEEALKRGKEIHSAAAQHLDLYVHNTLIDMYAKSGSMVEAQRVFEALQTPDVVSWNALLLGYVDNDEAAVALEHFTRMKRSPECSPDSVTYSAALKACASLAAAGEKENALKRGREIHSELGRHLKLSVQSTLVDMYAKCGSMDDARRAFGALHNPNVFSWTALILGHAENGDASIALELFSRMKNTPGCTPNAVTYVSALKACTALAASGKKDQALKLGRELHSEAAHYLHRKLKLQATLIDMYANCGSMTEARTVFDSLNKPSVACWTALLHGYAENGDGATALELFSRMKNTPGCPLDVVAYIAVLKACSVTGALGLGRKIHAEMNEFTPQAVTCLVDFYSKCGSLAEACEVYDLQPRAKVLSTSNALLAGYARFGDTSFVFNLFEAQKAVELQPDGVTLLCMLVCCSHAGLVDKASDCFEAMSSEYEVTPDVSHYTCMVDALGRANRLHEAMEMVRRMPCQANEVTWMTLLASCRKWKNAEIGGWAFQSLIAMDKGRAPAYILMAQIYGSCSMWSEQQSVLNSVPEEALTNIQS